jgi:hypothetical protein
MRMVSARPNAQDYRAGDLDHLVRGEALARS